MSNLTTAQKTAIASGAPFRQTFEIGTPRASGSSTFDYATVHDCASGPICVTNAGRRTVEAYNVSFAEPGRLSSGLYVFQASNADGKWYTQTTSNHWYNSTGTYQALPKECLVRHKVYVLDSGSWSELSCLAYVGRVIDCEYDDTADMAEISSEAVVLSALRVEFKEEDSNSTDTGMNVSL